MYSYLKTFFIVLMFQSILPKLYVIYLIFYCKLQPTMIFDFNSFNSF